MLSYFKICCEIHIFKTFRCYNRWCLLRDVVYICEPNPVYCDVIMLIA